jgi:hypothetical protein
MKKAQSSRTAHSDGEYMPTNIRQKVRHVCVFIILFYHFYIYSHVYTLFGPSPPDNSPGIFFNGRKSQDKRF